MEETQIIDQTVVVVVSATTPPTTNLEEEKKKHTALSQTRPPLSNYCLKLIPGESVDSEEVTTPQRLFPLVCGSNRIGRAETSDICILHKVKTRVGFFLKLF
jgi:hypothetical protein